MTLSTVFEENVISGSVSVHVSSASPTFVTLNRCMAVWLPSMIQKTRVSFA